PEGLVGTSFATHFQGISSPQAGVYTLSANTTNVASGQVLQATFSTVRRNADGTFGPASWVNLDYPNAVGAATGDSVADNQVVGIVPVSNGTGGVEILAYQATVNLSGQVSNVISGNRGNGIGLYGASNNRIAMNNIGTDATGTLGLGNRGNGILVTKR